MKTKTISASYALRIALPFFLISLAWILFSDRFVEGISPDVSTLTTLQTYKGWFYITVSAIFVYLTSRHYLNRLSHSQHQISAAESALAHNQEGMMSLLANLPGMAYRCAFDNDRRMDFVSQNCKSGCGFDASELIGSQGKPWNSLIVDEDREMVIREIKQAIRDRRTYHLEYRIDLGHGRTKWVSDHGCAIHTATGDDKLLVGYIFEISESRNRRAFEPNDQPEQMLGTLRKEAERSVTQGSNLMSRPF